MAQSKVQARYILEMREVWFVPFVNPDGYVANQAGRYALLSFLCAASPAFPSGPSQQGQTTCNEFIAVGLSIFFIFSCLFF